MFIVSIYNNTELVFETLKDTTEACKISRLKKSVMNYSHSFTEKGFLKVVYNMPNKSKVGGGGNHLKKWNEIQWIPRN